MANPPKPNAQNDGERRLRRLRWMIFRIWYVSLVTLLASFAYAAFFYRVPLDSSELLKSATLMLGLILPPLGAIFAFYRSARVSGKGGMSSVSAEFFEIAVASSVLYHFVLDGLVIGGVALERLVPPVGPEALYRNCVFIVNWMGLLSVLLGPAAWLFSGASGRRSA